MPARPTYPRTHLPPTRPPARPPARPTIHTPPRPPVPADDRGQRRNAHHAAQRQRHPDGRHLESVAEGGRGRARGGRRGEGGRPRRAWGGAAGATRRRRAPVARLWPRARALAHQRAVAQGAGRQAGRLLDGTHPSSAWATRGSCRVSAAAAVGDGAAGPRCGLRGGTKALSGGFRVSEESLGRDQARSHAKPGSCDRRTLPLAWIVASTFC
jgi:hypothetical protein